MNPMLAAVIGGALHGIAIGILFRLETTTGGTDVIIKIIRQKKPHLKTGQLYIILDLVILAASAVAFRISRLLFMRELLFTLLQRLWIRRCTTATSRLWFIL